MSKKHPVVAVTGSSGAGTTFVKRAFEKIFQNKSLNVAVIEGDSFHKYERAEMRVQVEKTREGVKCLLTLQRMRTTLTN